MTNHITKDTHNDGAELNPKIAWCGHEIRAEWAFIDTHHAMLSIFKKNYAALSVCSKCTDAIVEAIEKNKTS